MTSSTTKYNTHIERIRSPEYPQLLGTTYLDHAGTTLYARSLIDAYHQDLATNLYGNPHSICPASDLSTRRVDEARSAVLKYFGADPEHFDVVFTANATAAIKLVADCFRDQDFEYTYHKDVHTSIVGVRALASSTSRCLATDQEVEDWIAQQKAAPSSKLQLFAYPAQSNMTGYRPPYAWCHKVRNACHNSEVTQNVYVLLDAASYLTSGRLDLSHADLAPDFIALSFYKIFGFPDLGALLVKKSAFNVMTHRRYFGGGTVDTVTVIGKPYQGIKRQTLHDFLEDGTLPFHNILALTHAIATHGRIYGTAKDITQHVTALIAWLFKQLSLLKHLNGRPVLAVYKDPLATHGDPSTQGPIIAFNMLNDDGSFVGKSHVERLAIACGFQLRTGGVCNPGGIATMLDLSHWELMRNFIEGVRCGGDVDVMGAKPTGIVRVSLGPMSTMSDVERFVEFVKHFFVEREIRSPQAMQKPCMTDDVLATISPIAGCRGSSVTTAAFASFSPWHGQWCIINTSTGMRIEEARILDQLGAAIDVDSEQLVISHRLGSRFAVDLWSIPDSAKNHPRDSARLFDLYEDEQLNGWLTSSLGVTCALAYIHKDFHQTEDAETCVVSGCKKRLACTDLLANHYSSHAEAFLVMHPFFKDKSATNSIRKKSTDWWRVHRKTGSLQTYQIGPTSIADDGKTSTSKSATRISTVEIKDPDERSVVETRKTTRTLSLRTLTTGKAKNPKFGIVVRAAG